jgi:uncharacterized protein (DUF58 family)
MIPADVLSQIRRIQIRTNRIIDEILAGQYQSVFKGRGMEFKEVREYVPGDDIRMIDWNVTARTGHPQVKLLAEERELTVMFLVDASGSGRFGSVARFKNELAAEVCAVMAFSALRNNDKAGLMIFTDEVERFVPPAKGRKHVLRVIRDVLYYEPRRAKTDIAAALHYLNNVIRRRAVVFLLSDFMADNYEAPLRIAAKRHDLIAVTVDDPREAELPDVGLISIRDAESGQELLVDTSDARTRKRYAEAARKRRQERDALLRRNKIDTIALSTAAPYADQLYKFFRMREKRSA